MKTWSERLASFGIAALCFGYFAAYIPYSMGTKMITKGLFSGMDGVGFSGFTIAPATVFGSFAAMFIFITVKGWWKHATHSKILGISVPRPQWFTFISGICTAGVIVTTTLAYTFNGISIVFAMLLMRGGVLILAPIVDLIATKRKRKIYWPSWVGALLSFGALFASFSSKAGTALTVVAAVDIGIYLLSYFVRFIFMANRAKSSDTDEMKRYFVEEQLTANPILFLTLFVWGLFGIVTGPESIPGKLLAGFTEFPFSGYFLHALIIGVFSYGTGLFGTLILLDRREHTFCVPANRCSSVVAGVVATYLLAIFYGQRYPDAPELIGVALILGAIIFLSYRAIMDKKQKAVEAGGKKKVSMKCCEENE